MLTENETNVLLERSPRDRTSVAHRAPSLEQVPILVAAQGRLNPNRLAVVTATAKLTYAELDLRAAQLASHLQGLGAGPEVIVGLGLERSPEFVIAALAIMKSGAAYLPMDLAHPTERLRFILKDAGARLVVTQDRFADRFREAGVKTIDVDAEVNEVVPLLIDPIQANIDCLAYVIYTSGSTGLPKGVEVTHRNLANLIAWHVKAFDVDYSSRATFQAGVGFDAAVWEIWPYLTLGAAVYVPDESTRLSADALRDWLICHEITVSFVPTTIAEQMIARPWPPDSALRFLLTGADTLHRRPLPGLPFSFVNNYGPTECTVVATSGTVGPEKYGEGLPSIGQPIDNVSIHLLDEHRRYVPQGATGEIYIGGAGVARGYRNRPDLTAERFLPDPFGDEGDRLYRTGDLGRFLPNGEIAFQGRIDDQIKIRGYRIELNEINAVINAHPSVEASIVIVREDSPNDKRLVAYVVPRPGSDCDEQGIRQLVRTRLPDYMEPSTLVWMDSFPLTPNGKLDRAALPVPTIGDGASGQTFIAPRTPVEETLAGIISEVLKVPRVSVDDDFFHLGAHSLLGAQIIARVRGAFGTELRLLDVFDAPTVAELSLRIEQALTLQLNAMSEAQVEAALAALDAPMPANIASR